MQIFNRKQPLLRALLGQENTIWSGNLSYFPDLKPVFLSKSYKGDTGRFKVYNFSYFEKNGKFKFFTKILLLDPLNRGVDASQVNLLKKALSS